jgi:C4-type Zn-finger protein
VPEVKECPLCGEIMRLNTVERREHVPGMSDPKPRVVREWVCSECDYFEEWLDEG